MNAPHFCSSALFVCRWNSWKFAKFNFKTAASVRRKKTAKNVQIESNSIWKYVEQHTPGNGVMVYINRFSTMAHQISWLDVPRTGRKCSLLIWNSFLQCIKNPDDSKLYETNFTNFVIPLIHSIAALLRANKQTYGKCGSSYYKNKGESLNFNFEFHVETQMLRTV